MWASILIAVSMDTNRKKRERISKSIEHMA